MCAEVDGTKISEQRLLNFGIKILSDEKLTEVKEEITLIFNKLGVIHGEFNIESYYNDKGKLFGNKKG